MKDGMAVWRSGTPPAGYAIRKPAKAKHNGSRVHPPAASTKPSPEPVAAPRSGADADLQYFLSNPERANRIRPASAAEIRSLGVWCGDGLQHLRKGEVWLCGVRALSGFARYRKFFIGHLTAEPIGEAEACSIMDSLLIDDKTYRAVAAVLR